MLVPLPEHQGFHPAHIASCEEWRHLVRHTRCPHAAEQHGVQAHLSLCLGICHHAAQQAEERVHAHCILDQDRAEPVAVRGFNPL